MVTPPKSTPRDADKTRARFLKAVEKVLRKEGLQGLGINAVARAAGRDKALLYKYFGSLDGLYVAYAQSYPLFPTLEQVLGPAKDKLASLSSLDIARIVASGYIREIRQRPFTLEIMRWELVVSNSLTKALSELRSAATEDFIRLLGQPKGVDIPAFMSLLYGGVVYLLLKAESGVDFSGMDLRGDEAWKRLEKTLHRILEATLSPP